MRAVSARVVAAVAVALALAGCGASAAGGPSAPASTASASTASASTPSASAPGPIATSQSQQGSAISGPDQARRDYLGAVNSLCDRLLTEIQALASGGDLSRSAASYLREWPSHRQALQRFDRDLAAVPVPQSAVDASRAMKSYVGFADRLDAKRLAAARAGETAYRKEIAAEADVEDDPTVTARDAAGFAPSCDAR